MAEEDDPPPRRHPAPARRKTPIKRKSVRPSADHGAAFVQTNEPASVADELPETKGNAKAKLPKPRNKPKKSAEEIRELPYDVGKYKPSKATQFTKNNKRGKGRPPGSRNANTLAKEALDQKIVLGGEVKTVRELAFMQQATKAGRGELKPLMFLLDVESKTAASNPDASPSERTPLTDNEKRTIEHYYRRQFSKEELKTK